MIEDAIEPGLKELQRYHRQMAAMSEMMTGSLDALSEDSPEACCPSCMRVMGILEACAAIMQQR